MTEFAAGSGGIKGGPWLANIYNGSINENNSYLDVFEDIAKYLVSRVVFTLKVPLLQRRATQNVGNCKNSYCKCE